MACMSQPFCLACVILSCIARRRVLLPHNIMHVLVHELLLVLVIVFD